MLRLPSGALGLATRTRDPAVAPAEGDGRVDRALDLLRVVPELPGRPVRVVARRDDRLVATDMDIDAVLLRRESAAR